MTLGAVSAQPIFPIERSAACPLSDGLQVDPPLDAGGAVGSPLHPLPQVASLLLLPVPNEVIDAQSLSGALAVQQAAPWPVPAESDAFWPGALLTTVLRSRSMARGPGWLAAFPLVLAAVKVLSNLASGPADHPAPGGSSLSAVPAAHDTAQGATNRTSEPVPHEHPMSFADGGSRPLPAFEGTQLAPDVPLAGQDAVIPSVPGFGIVDLPPMQTVLPAAVTVPDNAPFVAEVPQVSTLLPMIDAQGGTDGGGVPTQLPDSLPRMLQGRWGFSFDRELVLAGIPLHIAGTGRFGDSSTVSSASLPRLTLMLSEARRTDTGAVLSTEELQTVVDALLRTLPPEAGAKLDYQVVGPVVDDGISQISRQAGVAVARVVPRASFSVMDNVFNIGAANWSRFLADWIWQR